jgi:hypothetical protein
VAIYYTTVVGELVGEAVSESVSLHGGGAGIGSVLGELLVELVGDSVMRVSTNGVVGIYMGCVRCTGTGVMLC